jgi:hypothetical protein
MLYNFLILFLLIGISLTAAQFQKLKAIIPEVDAELKKM